MARGRPSNDNEQRKNEVKNYFLGLIGSTKKIEDINYINLLHGNSFKH